MIWLSSLLSLVFLVYLAGWRLPRRILVPDRRTVNLTPTDLGFDYEEIDLTTSDGLRLAAYFVPAPSAVTNLIVLHGNASCKELYLEYLPDLISKGLNLLLIDQRAHGRSEGRYHTFGYHEWRDVEAAAHFLSADNALPTGVFGHSMGGAVAMSALARAAETGDGPGALANLRYGIVESTFANFSEVTHAYARRLSGLPLPTGITRALLLRAGQLADFDPFVVVPEELAARVAVPVLIIHGTDDDRIPSRDGKRLFDALPTPGKDLYLVDGAGHDDVCGAGGRLYWARLVGFILRTVGR